jgi:hypothetical protein
MRKTCLLYTSCNRAATEHAPATELQQSMQQQQSMEHAQNLPAVHKQSTCVSKHDTPKGVAHFTTYFTTYFTTRKAPVSASIERKKGAKNDTQKEKPRDRGIP